MTIKILIRPSVYCIVAIALMLIGCIPKRELKWEKFVLPIGCKGYYAVIYGDNYDPIEDTSEIRVFNFDSARIILTKLKLNKDGNMDLFLRNNGTGLDTLQRRLYPGESITEKSIYTSRVQTLRLADKTKDVIIYVFYVGIPSSDHEKEAFLFDRKLDSVAKVNFFDKEV